MQRDLWSIGTVDLAVQISIFAAGVFTLTGLAILVRLIKRRRFDGQVFENLLFSLGILGGVLAVFVAYATLRNQTQLSSEIAINEDGARIADWERQSYAVRCAYGWNDRFSPANSPDQPDPKSANHCLARIVADRETYTEVMLYVEEVFFLLQQATRDKEKWGSNYADDIDYWRRDVSDDPTGVFAFHLVHRYRTIKAPKDPTRIESNPSVEMAAAGVSIEDLCGRAQRVSVCIEAAGRFAEPLPLPFCSKHIPLQPHHPLIQGVADACRAEALGLSRGQAGSPK